MKPKITEILKKYLEEIHEGLSEPLPVILDKINDDYVGEFEITGSKYVVYFNQTSEGCFIFKFTKDDSYELSYDIKKTFQVLPTIKNVVTDFIETVKPKLLSFTKTDGSRGRDRFYSELTNQISKDFNYEKNIKEFPDNIKLYVLFTLETTEEDFLSLFNWLSRN